MSRYIYGDRVGRLGKVVVGCSAVIFDEAREKVLLTRRTDNGRWCLPSGKMEAGESVAEACIREVWEETGLQVRVVRLVGVYSDPHRLTEYPDGNRFHLVGLCFEAEPAGGELGLSAETTEAGYFTIAQVRDMDILEPHRQRIMDAVLEQAVAFIR